jgi:hypothetical protein
MDAAELTTALNTVEQDHRLVLDKVHALKEAVMCVLDPGDLDTHRFLGRLREMNEYFATHFAAHLEEEEATLFPLLERHTPGGAELVGRLRLEHEEIRRKREDFGNCVGVATDVEDNLPRAVRRDLITLGWELWELLDDHAHVETRAVHECVGRYLRAEASAGSAP